MDPIWDTLYDAGVELVVAGHDHDYERFAPLNAGGNVSARGITSFVVGTGGREFYEFGPPVNGSRVRKTNTWGVLRLTLAPDGWSSRFLAVAGDSFTDTARGTCH